VNRDENFKLKVKQMNEKKEEAIQFPPIAVYLAGGPDDQYCPIVGAAMTVFPIMRPGSSLLAPQQQQGAFARAWSPCIKANCALWDDQAGACSHKVANMATASKG
jgi:hypothetical protein